MRKISVRVQPCEGNEGEWRRVNKHVKNRNCPCGGMSEVAYEARITGTDEGKWNSDKEQGNWYHLQTSVHR